MAEREIPVEAFGMEWRCEVCGDESKRDGAVEDWDVERPFRHICSNGHVVMLEDAYPLIRHRRVEQ